MKKICLTLIGIYLLFMAALAQSRKPATGPYHNRTLRTEEVNLITGYYQQDGNHSAVTGGIGTQQLMDASNIVQLKFVKWDHQDRKRIFETELGVDYHTAASAGWVSKTGASNPGGTRIYPSLTWKRENEAKGSTLGWGLTYSGEYNYHSYGANLSYAKTSADGNREFTAKLQIYADRVKLIQPSEFNPVSTAVWVPGGVSSASRRGGGASSGGYFLSSASRGGIPSDPRNTINTSLSYSTVVNKDLQVAILADMVAQQGYLGLPFHRVYWKDGSVHIEKLPTSRIKIPIGARISYYAGDRVIIRGYYRFYTDSWGIHAHTASLELPVKVTPFLSLSPFYRLHTQTAANWFAPYKTHTSADAFYTSNYDYSAFDAQYLGLNIRFSPPSGVLGLQRFSLIELRGGHYVQTTGLNANSVSVNFRFK